MNISLTAEELAEIDTIAAAHRVARSSQVVGYIKGKSAIHLARIYGSESAIL